MTRFLIAAIPALLLLFGLFTVGMEALDLEPEWGELERLGLARHQPLPPRLRLGGWLIETLGLTALFLLIQGRAGSWWLDGLSAGLIAWIFRGPVLVLTVVSLSRLSRDPWWPMSLRWLLLYGLCGLVLSGLARGLRLERAG